MKSVYFLSFSYLLICSANAQYYSNNSVNVLNFPVTQVVAGTVAVSNFPVTQVVSGAVSITNLPVTQSVSGTVAVSNQITNFAFETGGNLASISATNLNIANKIPVGITVTANGLKVDGSAATQPIDPIGKTPVFRIRNDYSSISVTAVGYTQLLASTSTNSTLLYIFDSSGQDFVLATGGVGAEVDQIQISPGGWDAPVNVAIPAASRLSIKSKSSAATSGILLITGMK